MLLLLIIVIMLKVMIVQIVLSSGQIHFFKLIIWTNTGIRSFLYFFEQSAFTL